VESWQEWSRHAACDQVARPTSLTIVSNLLYQRLPLALISCTMLLTAVPTRVDAQDSSNEPALSSIHDPSELAPAPSTWKGAIADSLRLLVIEHTIRIAFQDKTRSELGGPFFRDYKRSLKFPKTWTDGDGWGVNYIGHPIHGAAAGFIWLDHEDGAHDPKLGFSTEIWTSRSRAFAWAATYSIQFEFGLLSEASIGNVGLRPGTTGWVDHVVTPAGALGFMVAEDVLDRYLMTRIESWTGNRVLLALSRMALNPSRTLSNAAQGRSPWFRAARPLRTRPSGIIQENSLSSGEIR
jgi:hypothetical protein